MPSAKSLTQPRISVWVNGPAGSGKTRLALGFPKVFLLAFDPSGVDIIWEPENAALRQNLVHYVPMNGLPLKDLFKYTETPGEDSLYGALALAKQMAAKGEVETVLIDGFTYLAQLKWTQICEAEGIDASEKPIKKSADQRGMYDALGSYLDHLVLQNFFPMCTRNRVHCIVTSHVQRESDNTVKGMEDSRNPDAERASKRLVNLQSDLSPQVVGGFRQRIDGLPSAMIYLDHQLVTDNEGKESLRYYAYCRMTYVKSLDTVVKSKNRFGLGTLNLTNASFYKTLMKKITDAQNGKSEQKPATVTAETDASKTAETESATLTADTAKVKAPTADKAQMKEKQA